MALDDIIQVSITSATVTPTRPGFGTPLVAAGQVPVTFTDRVREYGSLSEMIDDGFTTTYPAYKAVAAGFRQSPRPPKIKVGRRANKTVQVLELTCLSAVENDIYSGKVNGLAFTYTVPASATTTTVATALELIIEALTGVDSVSAAAKITVTPTAGSAAGTLLDVSELTKNIKFFDASTDPGLEADLNAINAEDSDWFGLALDSQSKAEIQVAATWIEGQKKIAAFNSSDSDVKDSNATTDIASVLKGLAYLNSGVLYSGKQLLSYSGMAWMANRFAGSVPGADTWAYKSLKGVPPEDKFSMTSGQRNATLAKNGNVYDTVAGVNITEKGTVASGEYFDIRRGVFWLESELKIRVFAALANNAKIPYTDKGVEVVVSIVKGVLQDAIRVGFLSDSPYPVVVAPKVADIDPVTRGTRVLPDVKFTATLAGAIHTVLIEGTVSV